MSGSVRGSFPSRDDVHEHTPPLFFGDDQENRPRYIHQYRSVFLPSKIHSVLRVGTIAEDEESRLPSFDSSSKSCSIRISGRDPGVTNPSMPILGSRPLGETEL